MILWYELTCYARLSSCCSLRLFQTVLWWRPQLGRMYLHCSARTRKSFWSVGFLLSYRQSLRGGFAGRSDWRRGMYPAQIHLGQNFFSSFVKGVVERKVLQRGFLSNLICLSLPALDRSHLNREVKRKCFWDADGSLAESLLLLVLTIAFWSAHFGWKCWTTSFQSIC